MASSYSMHLSEAISWRNEIVVTYYLERRVRSLWLNMEYARREIRLRNFGFAGVSVTAFVSSQSSGQCRLRLLCAYRIFSALYQLSWNVVVPVARAGVVRAKWAIFLTNWTFCVLTLYLAVAAASVVAYMRQSRRQVDDDSSELVIQATCGQGDLEQNNQPQQEITPWLPWYFKLTWLLQDIAYSACALVTLGYWLLLFEPGEVVDIFTFHVHGVNLIIVLIDVIVVAPPFRLLHFVYPYFYFVLYQIFALVYYKAGGTNPYGETYVYKGFIDWEYASTATLVFLLVGSALGALCFHAIFFALCKLRNAIANNCAPH